jgi:hypothetical protein
MKTRRILMLGLAVFLLQSGCAKKAVAPGEGKTGFRFDVKFGSTAPAGMTAGIRAHQTRKTAKTAVPGSYYNMVRVLVTDMSGYHVNNWAEYERTADGQDYARARDSWTGNRRSHAAWKGFLGGFFNIIVDQDLTITGDHALGVVNGAVGLNHVIVALTDGDLWVYRGEADVIGKEGEVTSVEMYMENVESWTNL